MSARFQVLPTPDPEEFVFQLTVDDKLFRGPSNFPTKGQTYASWNFGPKERLEDEEWDSFVYLEPREAGAGQIGFLFGRSKDDTTPNGNGLTDKDTPFETTYDEEMYEWPAVIEAYNNYTFTSATVSGGALVSTPIVDVRVKSATRQMSTVKIEKYLDANPWDVAKLRHMRPITDDVELNPFFRANGFASDTNNSARVSNCLHGELALIGSGDSVGVVIKTTANGNSSAGGLVLPPTNFTNWAPFVLSDTQTVQNGMWYRVKKTIFPPIGGKTRPL